MELEKLTLQTMKRLPDEDWVDFLRQDFETRWSQMKADELLEMYLDLLDEINSIKPIKENVVIELQYNIMASMQLVKDEINEKESRLSRFQDSISDWWI